MKEREKGNQTQPLVVMSNLLNNHEVAVEAEVAVKAHLFHRQGRLSRSTASGMGKTVGGVAKAGIGISVQGKGTKAVGVKKAQSDMPVVAEVVVDPGAGRINSKYYFTLSLI